MTKKEKMKEIFDIFTDDEPPTEKDYSNYYKYGKISEKSYGYITIMNLLSSTDIAIFSGFKSGRSYSENTIENGKLLEYLHSRNIHSYYIVAQHKGTQEDIFLIENNFKYDSEFVNLLFDFKNETNLEHIVFTLGNKQYLIDDENIMRRIEDERANMDIFQLYAMHKGFELNDFVVKGAKVPDNTWIGVFMFDKYGLKYIRENGFGSNHPTKPV